MEDYELKTDKGIVYINEYDMQRIVEYYRFKNMELYVNAKFPDIPDGDLKRIVAAILHDIDFYGYSEDTAIDYEMADYRNRR